MPCFRYFLLPFLCLGLSACSNTSSVSSANIVPDYPDIITVERGGFTPEGIEYNHFNQRFLLGSFIEGKVFALAANGELTTVVDDPDVDAIIGIEIEEDRQRILAAIADPGVFAGQTNGFALVGVFDLNSGARLDLISLDDVYIDAPAETRFFPNDLVADSTGNIYVTDSFAVVVYKIDTQGAASVFVRRNQFPETQSIKGITSHPDGYLLIAGSGTGVLYKADTRYPENFSVVGLPEKFPGIDGMVWDANGNLVMTSSGRTVVLNSHDNWASAQLVAAAPQGAASTVARVGDDVYVVYPHFADQEPPTVEKVYFENQ
ncbi:hypothetical protein N8600_02885 [Gammaproteobacteria bacterium]|nr:hypothetical protein [Gammaproteobacteria bacterium]